MRIKRMATIAAAALLALATATSAAADGNRVRTVDLNLRDVRSFVLDNPCTPVPDDTIELIGHVRVIMQVVETPTGTQSSLVHFNQSFRGEDAAGVDYTVILTEQNMAHLSLDGPRGSVAFTLNIISHGGTGNLVVKTIGNSNGIVVDTAECRG